MLYGGSPSMRSLLGEVAAPQGACSSPPLAEERICTPLFEDVCDEASGEVWYPSVDDCIAATEGAVACDVPENAMLFGADIGCTERCDAENSELDSECTKTWSYPVCIRMPTEQEVSFLEQGLFPNADVAWSPDGNCNGKCPRGAVAFTMCDPAKGPFRNVDGVWEAFVENTLPQPWRLSLDPSAPNDHPAICAPDIRMRQCGMHPSGDSYAFIADGLPCESSMQCYQGAPADADPEAYRPYASVCLPAPDRPDVMTCQPDCSDGACDGAPAEPERRAPLRLNAENVLEPIPVEEMERNDEPVVEEEQVPPSDEVLTDEGQGDETEQIPEEQADTPPEEEWQEEVVEEVVEDVPQPILETEEFAMLDWLRRHPLCGNGRLDGEQEECDDGNTKDRDGCSFDCYFEKGSCGDGVVEVLLGEQCEPKKHNPSLPYICTPDCRFLSRSCGDGMRQAGEQCDMGNDNANSPGSMCRSDCSFARCGDLIVDGDEECDDGNLIHGDGCSRTCKQEQAREVVMAKKWTDASLFRFLRGSAVTTVTTTASTLPAQLPTGAPVPQSGPGIIAVMAAGAAGGIAWMRRRRS